ncbi:hypothetical protein P8773_20205 [Klebsiella pneumoniae]
MNLSGVCGEQGGKGERGERRKGSGWQVELGLREEAVVIAGGIGALE